MKNAILDLDSENRRRCRVQRLFLFPMSKPSKKTEPVTHAPADVAAACRQKILDAAAAITASLITEAREGSYQAAKFLFEFAGLMQTPVPEPSGPQPTELVLAELKRILAEEPASPQVE